MAMTTTETADVLAKAIHENDGATIRRVLRDNGWPGASLPDGPRLRDMAMTALGAVMMRVEAERLDALDARVALLEASNADLTKRLTMLEKMGSSQ